MGQDIDGRSAGDKSGLSVSLSGDEETVAIGAPDNDGINGTNSGHVRAYKWDDSLSTPDWVQMGQNIDGEAEDDWSGVSVSLSGDGETVAIGAPRNEGNGYDSGHCDSTSRMILSLLLSGKR